jgi:NADPH:quinone reductase
MAGGAMYAQYRAIKAIQCLVLPEGTTPADGASCFVNPLTTLGMAGTMRLEGHTALVHTAAASNLGQEDRRIGGRGWQVPVDAEGWPCHVWCSA